MTYKILNTRQQDQILFTEVEYNFNDTIVTVEIAHFSPQSTQDIETNIANRAQSELAKLEQIQLISELLPNIEINEVKNINI